MLCRLVREMLETKQKSEADAEEEKRKLQQSALAKYRQAFANDTEVFQSLCASTDVQLLCSILCISIPCTYTC